MRTIRKVGSAVLGLVLVLSGGSVQAAAQKIEDTERQQCTQNLKQIYQAIRAYQLDHRDMPPWLSDLVPKYLPDTNVLRCPTHQRTGEDRSFGLSDPKVRGSYLYEFCGREAPSGIASVSDGWKQGMTMKDWKVRQLLIFGADVPMVRCWHHTPVLNLAFSGEVYESDGMWEVRHHATRGLQTASEAPVPLAQWRSSGGSPEDYLMGMDPDVRYAGQPAGRLYSKTSEAEGQGTFMQQFKADSFRGQRLRMTARVKAEAVEQWAGLWMRVDGPEGETLAFDNMQQRPIKGTVDWKSYSIVLDVPEKSQLISAGLLLTGAGKAWIADVKFEEVPRDVASTDLLRVSEEPVPLAKWFPSGTHPDRYLAGIDPEVRYAGGPVGRLHSQTDKADGAGACMQQFKADRFRGRRIRMSAQVKVENVEQGAGLFIAVQGPENEVLAHDEMEKRLIKGTADWEPYSIVLEVPEKSRVIYAGLALSGTGKVWIADVKFEAVSDNVPTTGIAKASEK